MYKFRQNAHSFLCIMTNKKPWRRGSCAKVLTTNYSGPFFSLFCGEQKSCSDSNRKNGHNCDGYPVCVF